VNLGPHFGQPGVDRLGGDGAARDVDQRMPGALAQEADGEGPGPAFGPVRTSKCGVILER